MIPHRCPVCDGCGLVPQGFYTAVGQPYFNSTSIMPETCRACGGAGVYWETGSQDRLEKAISMLQAMFLKLDKKGGAIEHAGTP